LIELTINDRLVEVEESVTVAAAVFISEIDSFRRSITGETRGPLCGIGICFECRVTIDGVPHVRSCNIVAREGMKVSTDE
jgi:sarcosine oxidase subunit alpha